MKLKPSLEQKWTGTKTSNWHGEAEGTENIILLWCLVMTASDGDDDCDADADGGGDGEHGLSVPILN